MRIQSKGFLKSTFKISDIGDSLQLDAEVASVVNEKVNKRKRRRLIIDEVKNITGDEMKANMSNFDDILSQPDLAPPTKKLMHLREHGVTEKLFSMPGCQALTNPDLIRVRLLLKYCSNQENVFRFINHILFLVLAPSRVKLQSKIFEILVWMPLLNNNHFMIIILM